MNESWNSPWARVLFPTLLLVSAGGTFALACGLWRAIDLAYERDRRLLAEQQKFHSASVDAMHRLAENAGLLTSADLCPVRFRLRGGAEYEPLACAPLRSELWVRSASGLERVADARMNRAGTAEFGLNPPGSYRLVVQMEDGMCLEHDFEVLGGVPVDRLVSVPRPVPGAPIPIRLAIAWPQALADAPLVAICRIEPAPYVEQEWRWSPNLDWQPVYAVASTGMSGADVLDPGLMQLDADVFPAECVELPYHYARVTEITFLNRHISAAGVPGDLVELMTVHFPVAGETPDFASETSRHWCCETPAPPFRAVSSPDWTLHFPDEVISRVLARLEEVQPVDTQTAVTLPARESLTLTVHETLEF